MAVEKTLVGAAGEAAAAIAEAQRPANGGRDRARAPSDVERPAALIEQRGHDPSVAGDAAERFRRNARAVVQGRRKLRCAAGGLLARATAGQQVALEVNDH